MEGRLKALEGAFAKESKANAAATSRVKAMVKQMEKECKTAPNTVELEPVNATLTLLKADISLVKDHIDDLHATQAELG